MNLKYCLMITGPAYGNQRSSSALQFSQALLDHGHYISTIFFYQDGTYNANRLSTPASDEVDLVRAWRNLSYKHKITLYVCVSSALRRGIINKKQSLTLNRTDDNLQEGFELSGLCNLSKEIINCDRFIQF